MADRGRPVREPRRTCVGCRTVADKSRLVRLAGDGEGGVAVDPRPAIGRGAYVCPSASCLEEALRRNALPRALRAALPRLDRQRLREGLAEAGNRMVGAGARPMCPRP